MSPRPPKKAALPIARTLGDRILLRREPTPEMAGSIVVPVRAREKAQECEVVAVGPGRFTPKGERIPPDVHVGEQVMVGKYSGHEISHDGADYLVIREDDIICALG